MGVYNIGLELLNSGLQGMQVAQISTYAVSCNLIHCHLTPCLSQGLGLLGYKRRNPSVISTDYNQYFHCFISSEFCLNQVLFLWFFLRLFMMLLLF